MIKIENLSAQLDEAIANGSPKGLVKAIRQESLLHNLGSVLVMARAALEGTPITTELTEYSALAQNVTNRAEAYLGINIDEVVK